MTVFQNKACATVLQDNQSMLAVFRKRYPNAKMTVTGGNEVSVVMEFKSHADP